MSRILNFLDESPVHESRSQNTDSANISISMLNRTGLFNLCR